MYDESPAELLHQLLDACNEGNHGALQLAEQTEIESLRSFLQESALQYRIAAADIRQVGQLQRHDDGRDGISRIGRPGCTGDVVATWERTECEALTYFRDAYDEALPRPVAETVKRHYEAGVARLERLRELQTRLS